MSFNFNVSTNIDITKKILKFISLLKLLKFKSFCNVNQHYLIIVLLPPPPPPPPSSPFFWGGRGGDGGEGTGGQGNGQGTIAPPPPPLNEGGGTKSPPLLPHRILQKKTFLPRWKHTKTFFSLNIQIIFKICVIYLP
jgi:hypothetical protein